MALLQVEDLSATYGQVTALRGISLTVDAGETLAVIGANGAGKTTLLRAIVGQVAVPSGRVLYEGKDVTHLSTFERARRGIVMVPEGRRLFASLTVEENLKVGKSARRSGSWTLDTVYDLFPLVAERRHRLAGEMSGGEQQATAIARALIANPSVLLLDEVSLGLAPAIVASIYANLPGILSNGTAVLLVEQDVSQALRVSDAVHCLLQGRTSLSGRNLEMSQISDAYFGYESGAQ
jgi:branched-chain amino acid transport system ATP-binding protein